MIRRRRTVRWALAVILLVGAAGDLAQLRAADWKRLDTPNFVVIGNVGAGDLRDTARQFEAFRETLGRLLGKGVTGSAVPTLVFVFASDRDFAPYKLLYNGKPIAMSGVCMPGPDLNQIAMIRFSDEVAARVLFHEYTHELLANVFRGAPVWFSEGLAEYYSTFEMRDDGRRALIGKPIASHVARLREGALLPIDTLIAVGPDSPLYNESDRRSMFYAESWALVHYLVTDDARRAQLIRYLGLLSQGGRPVEAWRQVFGTGVESALGQYLRQFAFTYTQVDFAEGLAPFEGKPVSMKEADARVALTGLLAGQRRIDETAAALASAIKLDPANQWATVKLAQLDLARNNRAAAEKRLAVLGEPADWLTAYEAGTVMTRLVDRPGVRITADEMAVIRRHFDQVARQHGEIANVLARSASLVLWTSDVPPLESVQSIQRARAIAPGREDYAFLHAQLLARRGEFAEARNILGPYISGAAMAGTRDRARNLMSYIVRLEEQVRLRAAADVARNLTGPQPPGTAPSGTTVPSEVPDPASVRPIFRLLKPGEQRLDGTLERIDCAPGGEVLFRIRTPDGVVTASARRMSNVEFITYRSDLTGSVTCGPTKPLAPVYVTWRAGTPAGTKYAVAIEFLPPTRGAQLCR